MSDAGESAFALDVELSPAAVCMPIVDSHSAAAILPAASNSSPRIVLSPCSSASPSSQLHAGAHASCNPLGCGLHDDVEHHDRDLAYQLQAQNAAVAAELSSASCTPLRAEG